MAIRTNVPQLCEYLDASEGINDLMPGVVRIPLSELAERMHELPVPSRQIKVVRRVDETIAFLASRGRMAIAAEPPAEADGIWRLWQPNEFLESIVSALAVGRALDLACGSGREAVFLGSRGWKVTAIDHLEDAIEKARGLESRYSSGPKVEWLVQDIQPDSLTGNFDLVTCFFWLNREVLSAAVDCLNLGGSLVVETFSAAHREAFGKPKDPNLVWQAGELEAFAREHQLTVRIATEAASRGRLTARMWAQRL